MLISDFVDKYAGSAWLISKQEITAEVLETEGPVARKMQQFLWQNYGVDIDYAPNLGFYAFNTSNLRFQGLNLCSKNEVALFLLFVVRYCFTSSATTEFFCDYLRKFALEYPEVAEQLIKFSEEVHEKSTSN